MKSAAPNYRHALVALALAACCRPAGAVETRQPVDTRIRQPSGFFVMQQMDHQNVSDATRSSPKWSGIVIRQRWSAIEPSANTYDWRFLDEQVTRAKRLNKKYILAIYTGDNDPTWLGVPLYLGAPYPWDANMLAEHGK